MARSSQPKPRQPRALRTGGVAGGPPRPEPLDLRAVARSWPPLDPTAFVDMNPSVVTLVNGETWVVFCRYQAPPTPGRGSIWSVQVDASLQPVGRPTMIVEDGIDPRVIAMGERTFVFFTSIERNARHVIDGSSVVMAEFTVTGLGWAAVRALRLPKAPLGHLRSSDSTENWEKNWVPFALDHDHVGLIYAHEPWQVLILNVGVEPRFTDAHVGPGLAWDYGTIRGGTPPVMTPDGHLITFFHSSQVVGRRKLYMVGACALAATAPFAPLWQTATPLLVAPAWRGAERFGWAFAGSVVFPLGAMRVEGGYDLMCGIDDGEIAVCRVSDRHLQVRRALPRAPNHATVHDLTGSTIRTRLAPAILSPGKTEVEVEVPMLNLARLLTGAGRTFVDIGAQVGSFAVGLATHFQRVVAVEACASSREWLLRNAALNAAHNVSCDTFGDDTPLDRLGLDDVDLLKIDSPGMEERCLSGALDTIGRSWPAILIKVAPEAGPSTGLSDALGDLGYDAVPVTPSWFLARPPLFHRDLGWLI